MSLPPSEIPQGAIRFNTDSQKLEFYAQGEWWNMVTDTPNLGRGADTTAGARGLIGGGYDGGSPSAAGRINTIEYINISSTGNSSDFGDLTATGRSDLAAFSSSIRGCWAGGFEEPSYTDIIDFVTIASTGDAQDFGDLTLGRQPPAACSNSTRGLIGGGYGNPGGGNADLDVIDYVTIASTGDVKDFDDLTRARRALASLSNSVRGVWGGGVTNTPSPNTRLNIIDFVTIASLGAAQDFGDLTIERSAISGCSNPIRGLFAGGKNPSSVVNIIDYITITTTGNAINFGDLSNVRGSIAALASPTRGVFAGGYEDPAFVSTIEYVNINDEGNAVDFGDLTVTVNNLTRSTPAGCSNAHGGL